jgi:hypothetical protein
MNPSRTFCVGVLALAVVIHLDWHLGRPGHDHLSFGLPWHWFLAIPTFVLVAWVAHRKWPGDAFRAAVRMTLWGLVVGQGLEPLGEMLLWPGSEPFADMRRWRVFAEFIAAGLPTLVLSLLWFRSRARTALLDQGP